MWVSDDHGDHWNITSEFALGCAEGEVVELPQFQSGRSSTLFASMRIDASAPHCTDPIVKHCRRTMNSTDGE